MNIILHYCAILNLTDQNGSTVKFHVELSKNVASINILTKQQLGLYITY